MIITTGKQVRLTVVPQEELKHLGIIDIFMIRTYRSSTRKEPHNLITHLTPGDDVLMYGGVVTLHMFWLFCPAFLSKHISWIKNLPEQWITESDCLPWRMENIHKIGKFLLVSNTHCVLEIIKEQHSFYYTTEVFCNNLSIISLFNHSFC